MSMFMSLTSCLATQLPMHVAFARIDIIIRNGPSPPIYHPSYITIMHQILPLHQIWKHEHLK